MPQVINGDAAHFWQPIGEALDAVELLAFSALAVFRVVEEL
jgi:hypothetical protein